MNASSTKTATFAAGCFWCYEPIFERVPGVIKVIPGYSGGHATDPSWHQLHKEETGYAEAFQIEFDPEHISYRKLLEVLFKVHDPTTLNRQGNDVGEQYRSEIFYHDLEQKAQAEEIITELTEANVYDDPIVTKISAFTNFYPAEDYHQNFYEKNKNHPYCQLVIQPKLDKFLKAQEQHDA